MEDNQNTSTNEGFHKKAIYLSIDEMITIKELLLEMHHEGRLDPEDVTILNKLIKIIFIREQAVVNRLTRS